jgi:23S rRNA (adenine2503-C2)-methyltransferase
MSNLSKDLRETLKEHYVLSGVQMADSRTSKDGETTKYLFRLSDDRVIESVWMKYHHGNSVCISSQVGCRMGCQFCASTLGGLERNLSASEMLSQIYEIQRLSGERVSNVVVMGTGEPLDNYDNLVKFIQILTDEHGLNISQRNITVSTCGLVPKIKELAEKQLQITLAISLHAPNDELRRTLMPVANKYSVKDVMEACFYYYQKTGRRITFEYSLVEGINDGEHEANQLCQLIKGLNCHVNLIPVNSIKERNFRHSSIQFIQKFKNILEKNRINVTIRREMGADIDAACGQLRKSYMDDMQKGD